MLNTVCLRPQSVLYSIFYSVTLNFDQWTPKSQAFFLSGNASVLKIGKKSV